MKYTFLKFVNTKQNTGALIVINHGKDKFLTTRLYFKYNRRAPTVNKYVEALINELPFKNAVERHVDLFATKEGSINLKETFTIMYSSDLEHMVDCDSLLGVPDSTDLSDEDFYSLWQPRAMDAIVDEMIEAVGTKNCKVVTGKH